ncbi:putative quinol monooxygenase [Carnobacterium gallinarum]|uniref:putative quinol monooxygenase n=1 Tax=Carnobacterium gallinarum TaxID=2749 RepID=UPI00054EEAFC|nr:putative quinol monooxygenase [Carnobacterium gallinarum]
MIFIQADLTIKPEERENFLKDIQTTIRASREEVGNQRYELMQSIEDSTKFTMLEIWTDQDAIAKHQISPHYQEFNKKAANWVVAAPIISLFQKIN